MIKLGFIAVTILALIAAQGMAQSAYPSRAIQIIVPFAAGGGNDLLARIVADKLQKKWGQPVIVENKPGAGGRIGTVAMLQRPADGYTLLLATNTMSMQEHIYKEAPYKVRTDFSALAKIALSPFVLAINPTKLPVNTVKELVAYVKAHSGKISYGSVGVGTPHHVGMEWFKLATGLNMVHVPYRGTAPALNDLIAGQTQLMFVTSSAVTGFLAKGQLKVLATAEPTRIQSLPNVPTLAEAGVPGVAFSSWYGVLVKAGTPADIQKKLSEALLEAVNEVDTKNKMASAGFDVSPDGPVTTQNLLNADLDKWGPIIEKIGLKIN